MANRWKSPSMGPSASRFAAATLRLVRFEAAGGSARITVAVAPTGPPPGEGPTALLGSGPRSRLSPTNLLHHRIEVLDASGRPMHRVVGRSGGTEGGGDLCSVRVGGEPARLRYHDLIATAIEVAFEFRDIPLP